MKNIKFKKIDLSKVTNKFKKLRLKTKVRIICLLFIFAVLGICTTTFFSTYTEYTSNPNNLNGVIGDTVYINDAEADWYHYMGLNYTYSPNGTLPSTIDKKIYTDKNLVETNITYNGTDIIRNETGYVSNTEQQSKYIYYKVYPVNDNGTTDNKNDDYILIELIDNPYGDRPNNLAFNGWVTNYSNAVISYDSVYYERYAKVPVSYTNNNPNDINITFNASWITATTANVNSNNSWSTAMNSLLSVGMNQINTGEIDTTTYVTGNYYSRITIYGEESCAGYYDENGVLQGNNCVCNTNWWRTCTYYESTDGEEYNNNLTYYTYNGYGMYSTTPNTNIETSTTYNEPYAATTNMAGYYKLTNITNGNSQVGYYDENGDALTTNCNNYNGCDVYELLQYANGTIDLSQEYYYLTTRDTNILVMTSNMSDNWVTSQSKPLTLTSLNNGTKYNVTWTVSSSRNGYVKCFQDTRIEYLTISAGTSYRTTALPAAGSTTRRTFYGNYNNVKLGRGLTSAGNNYATFLTAEGGNNNSNNVGNSTNLTKYKFVVESGYYSSVILTNSSDGNSSHYSVYVNAKGVYGNDYDRVAGTNGTNDNTKFLVYVNIAGSFNDNYYGANSTDIIFDQVYKSGNIGNSESGNFIGIYIGGRVGGTHYAIRQGKIEGGQIYNVIGGPLSASNRASLNDIYIYMTGGTVDMITGGAGETATYGNRIIQVTGGTVNYSVFGGSNGSDATSTTAGTVNGSGYVYIGGTAIIGNETYVNNNSTLFGSEAGSVFGIGNGQPGSSWEKVGSSDNSYVIINDKATIKRSVYGGGNFGAVGINSTATTTTTIIKVLDGTINDSIYGGGNNNGSGSSTKTSTVTIEMTGGTVHQSVYGGSNALGTIYGTTNVNIYGGSVLGNVYGGGKGGYVSSSNVGTFVIENSNVKIGNTSLSSTPIITGSVYGGSAYGSVNGNDRNSGSKSTSFDTNVTINKGTIGNVYGGGQGGSDGTNNYTPYVDGDIILSVNGGTIGTVYGGNDLSGLPSDDEISVNISDGTIGTVYGGGNRASVKGTNVEMTGGIVTSLYGGGFFADVNNSTIITIKGGSITNPNDNPEIALSGNVYGGCNVTGTVNGSSSITMTGGRVNGNIYGGGKGGYLNASNLGTYVLKNSTVTIGNDDIDTSPTIIGTVYGGSAFGSVNGNDRNSSNKTVDYNTTVIINKGTIANVFGGGQGGSDGTNNYTPYVDGDIDVIVTGGTILENVYGGNDLSGLPSDDIISVNISGGTIANVYGGGNKASVKATDVNITNGNITGVYGGGFSADVNGNTTINMSGGIASEVFGGCNIIGTVSGSSNVSVIGGTVNGHIYGGGKGGYLDSTNIGTYVLKSSTVTIGDLYSNLTPIISGTIYGGSAFGSVNGNSRNETTQSPYATSVFINKGTIATVFGGGQGGSDGTNNYTPYVEGNIIVSVNGGKIETLYGGNDLSGQPNRTISITVDNAEIDTIYGGGNRADSRITTVTVNSVTPSKMINNIFGGGNAADIKGDNNNSTIDANVIINDGIIGNIYGGSNSSGVVTSSKIQVANNSNILINNIYGGNNVGGTTNASNIDINGGIEGLVYGGSYGANATTGSSTINIDNATITGGIYGGGEQAITNGNINISINNSSVTGNVISTIDSGNTIRSHSGNIYGGGNRADVNGNTVLSITDSTLNIGDIFGGGNAGKVTGTTDVTLTNTTLTGTSYQTYSDESYITIDTGDVYGGGKSAGVKTGTMVDINSSNIAGNVFGGGDAGEVGYSSSIDGITTTTIANTTVFVTNSIINKNVFAGGNGRSAVVNGNTTITIDGTTLVGTITTEEEDGETVTVLHNGNVFGSGNEAATGLETNNDSTSTVNIAGGTFRGNVYGGANTAKVHGNAIVKIGPSAVNNSNLTSSNIDIAGTVFGGGEANASGSQIFDWNFISVTNGIDVLIDGQNINLSIGKSIFGSGNASSSGGASYVTIKNYGTHTDSNGDGIYESFNAKRNVSIQRATIVTLDNSVMELEGIADRTDEVYETTPFTIARVDQLKLKNNSFLFLNTNTNLLKRFTSVVTDMSAGIHEEQEPEDFDGLGDYEAFAEVTIDPETHAITRNVDNRLYIKQDENVNIYLDSNGTGFGPVDGMTFFGMYIRDNYSNSLATGIYNPSNTNESTVPTSQSSVFSSGSYVIGLRESGQDITKDGFYTRYINEDSLGQTSIDLYTNYINPIATQYSYKWVIGSPVMQYEIDLTASKYSTLGAKEVPLSDFSAPNTKFYISGFTFYDLDSNVVLTNKEDIPRLASSTTIANNKMSLVMESSNIGWITIGETTYLTDASPGANNYTGTLTYESENSDVTPSLIFYLYHSKNLGVSNNNNMGSVKISLQIEVPNNSISSTFTNLNIVINLKRIVFLDNNYEGAITAGKQYSMFANTTTNITSKSSYSAYFSLFAEDNSQIYQSGYKHTLISNYLLPENTKITMIDYANSAQPEYFYYVITDQDVIDVMNQENYILYGESSYDLSKFIRMGSSSSGNHYDDAIANLNYEKQRSNGTYYTEEEYIFIIDYSESNITTSQSDLQLLIELRRSDDRTIIGVLERIQRDMYYSIYHNSDAIINVSGNIPQNTIYVGKETSLDITTNLVQQNLFGATIYDTNYFDQKLGIQISMYQLERDPVTNELNETKLSGYDLLGFNFSYNNVNYYSRLDGSYRMNIAERVANVAAHLTLDARNSSLVSGTYRIKIESFGSPDGVYYGLTTSAETIIDITVVNDKYGLTVALDENSMVINSETGKNLIDSNSSVFTIRCTTSLTNANLRVALYRRDYSANDYYSTTYNIVQFNDYLVTGSQLNEIMGDNNTHTYQYRVASIFTNNINLFINWKDNLTTGTYKVVFSLYDGNTFIGEEYKYIFIK